MSFLKKYAVFFVPLLLLMAVQAGFVKQASAELPAGLEAQVREAVGPPLDEQALMDIVTNHPGEVADIVAFAISLNPKAASDIAGAVVQGVPAFQAADVAAAATTAAINEGAPDDTVAGIAGKVTEKVPSQAATIAGAATSAAVAEGKTAIASEIASEVTSAAVAGGNANAAPDIAAAVAKEAPSETNNIKRAVKAAAPGQDDAIDDAVDNAIKPLGGPPASDDEKRDYTR